MKVRNMVSSRGNKVPNQFIIEGDYFDMFQSYDSMIARIDYVNSVNDQRITLDERYWDYSRTTSKYLGIFLGESMVDVRKKVKSGEYKLANLN